jgi:RNA polymerase sigma factor (sigma-70 family)
MGSTARARPTGARTAGGSPRAPCEWQDSVRIDALFRDYASQLERAILRRLSCDRELARDACAHAWLQLGRRPAGEPSQVHGWLFVVALHEGYRLLGRERRKLLESQPQPDGRQPVPLAERLAEPRTTELRHEAREALRVLASLKPRQRETLALKAAGYSYREIQAIRGVTYTNVNRHVTEGRAAARRLRDAA